MAENGFKEAEIGLMPDDWDVIKLGDCIDTKKGRKPETLTNSFEDGFEPYLTADYFRTGNTKQFVNVEKEKNSIIVDKEDIVLIWDGSNAGDVFTGLRGILASTMVKIIPKNNLTRQHLFYFLKTKFDILNEKTTGSTIPHVSKSIFEGLPFVLPPLIEQQKIAFVLSKIQQAIEQQEKITAKTKELKRSLMHRLFTYGLRGEELKETEIGLMPESWSAKRLKDVVEKTNQRDMTKNPDIQFKYIDVSSISNESFKIIGSTTYKGSEAPSRARKIIKVSDVLFATVRPTLKRIAYVSSEFDGEVCSTAFCVLRSVSTLSSRYLYFCVQRDSFVESLGKLQRGASYPAVTDGNVKDQLIPFPMLDKQEEIANTLWDIDNKINHETAKKDMLQGLFKSMLQLLMTGKVRVKDIDFGEIYPVRE